MSAWSQSWQSCAMKDQICQSASCASSSHYCLTEFTTKKRQRLRCKFVNFSLKKSILYCLRMNYHKKTSSLYALSLRTTTQSSTTTYLRMALKWLSSLQRNDILTRRSWLTKTTLSWWVCASKMWLFTRTYLPILFWTSRSWALTNLLYKSWSRALAKRL